MEMIRQPLHRSSRNAAKPMIWLAAALSVLSLLLAAPAAVHALNYANLQLDVTVLNSTGTPPIPVSSSTVVIAHSVVSPVCFNGFLSVPVTVTAPNGIIDSVNLFYRKKGDADYVQATGANAFPPVSSNIKYSAPGVAKPAIILPGVTGSSYTGEATIPGEFITTLGVEYYIEAFTVDGSSAAFGTPAAPNFVQYLPEFVSTLSPEGGTFVLPGGDPNGGHTSLVIPAGVIAGNMSLIMRQLRNNEVEALPHGSFSPYSPPLAAYEFRLGDLHRFTKPILMTLIYKQVGPNGEILGLNGFDEKKMRIFWWDGYDWRYMGGQVDSDLFTVSAMTSHFSIFAVFPVGGVPPQTYRPKEKIITPNGDGTNDVAQFTGLSGNFDLQIFDITGKQIRTIHTIPEWDGRDDSNKVVENGTYIYQFRPVETTEWVSGVIGVAK